MAHRRADDLRPNIDPAKTSRMRPDDRRFAYVGLGLVFLITGFVELLEPHGPPTGHWRFLLLPLYESFGSRGVAALWMLAGALLSLISFFGTIRD